MLSWINKKSFRKLKITIGSFSKKTKILKPKKIDSLKKQNWFRSLTSRESKQLEGEVTVEELGSALTKMKDRKSLGIDGFPCILGN